MCVAASPLGILAAYVPHPSPAATPQPTPAPEGLLQGERHSCGGLRQGGHATRSTLREWRNRRRGDLSTRAERWWTDGTELDGSRPRRAANEIAQQREMGALRHLQRAAGKKVSVRRSLRRAGCILVSQPQKAVRATADRVRRSAQADPHLPAVRWRPTLSRNEHSISSACTFTLSRSQGCWEKTALL